MSKIKLSDKERNELKRLQKCTKDAKDYKKIAVILGLDSGFSYAALKEILSLDETTIRRYENIYLADGFKEYLKNNYIAYWGKLDSFQLAKLVKELKTNLYHTTSEVGDWIEKEFGVKYNHKGLCKLLHRLGFVYKKTKLIPSKADAEKQLGFVEEFNELKDNLKDNEVIYFGDAVHPQHNTKPS
ncbi:MAG: winged helix-turn-helix domain-containing protein, partial [Proteobacteria bacterium]|nr:winged helix-turn-helix domain-containing protein [Pseudomonadota bacterium]